MLPVDPIAAVLLIGHVFLIYWFGAWGNSSLGKTTFFANFRKKQEIPLFFLFPAVSGFSLEWQKKIWHELFDWNGDELTENSILTI